MMDHWDIMDFYKALFSVGAGLILGLERELKDKAAGLKTITVICLGSTLFTILSYKVGLSDNETTRIASYIVSGIGFIGAGVIFKDKLDVSGLTTAGIIWLAAAVGMAIGYGEFYLAANFILAALMIIFSSKWINKLIRPHKQKRDLVIRLHRNQFIRRDEILAAIRAEGIVLEEKRIDLEDDGLVISLEATIRTRKVKWLESFLLSHESILGFSM
jgi:putative Mg2+ transporter-C (MgtC) family protein